VFALVGFALVGVIMSELCAGTMENRCRIDACSGSFLHTTCTQYSQNYSSSV